jgi:hypothetical protein
MWAHDSLRSGRSDTFGGVDLVLLQALVLTLLLLVLLPGFDETRLQELAGPLAYGDCELA